MGKKSKHLRHIKKMQARRAEKAAKAARYAALAGTGANSRRKRLAIAEPGLRIRDDQCDNIGDLRLHSEMIPAALRLYTSGQYRGRFKGFLRDLVK